MGFEIAWKRDDDGGHIAVIHFCPMCETDFRDRVDPVEFSAHFAECPRDAVA